jgi:hypothetical protein
MVVACIGFLDAGCVRCSEHNSLVSEGGTFVATFHFGILCSVERAGILCPYILPGAVKNKIVNTNSNSTIYTLVDLLAVGVLYRRYKYSLRFCDCRHISTVVMTHISPIYGVESECYTTTYRRYSTRRNTVHYDTDAHQGDVLSDFE